MSPAFTFLILSSFTTETLGHCPGPTEPLCSSCDEDTAFCSRSCIGNSSFSKSYLTLLCNGLTDKIHKVYLAFNSLNHLDCSPSSLRLKTLHIAHNNISITDCTEWETNCFQVLRNLKYIDFSSNRIRNTCNASAIPFRKVKHVNLSNNEVTSLVNLHFFTSASDISVLDVSYNSITYLPWDPLVRKPSLVSLNVSHNNVYQLFTCHNFVPRQLGSEIYESCSDQNKKHVFTDSLFNGNYSIGTCEKSVSKVTERSIVVTQCNITNIKGKEVLRNESTTNEMQDINDNEIMETCSLSIYCNGISNTTSQGMEGDRWPFSRNPASSTLVGVGIVFFLLLFIGSIGVKFLYLKKKRQITRRDKTVVAVELYTGIGTTVTDCNYKKGSLPRDGLQDACYDEISGQKNSSFAIGKIKNGDTNVHDMGQASSERFQSLRPDTAEPSNTKEIGVLPWYKSTENIRGTISYHIIPSSCEDIDKNDNDETMYSKIDEDNYLQEPIDFEGPLSGGTSECLNLIEESACDPYTIPVDCTYSSMRRKESCHFKGEEKNQAKGDPNQYMEILEEILDLDESESLEMVENPCYEHTVTFENTLSAC